MGTNLHFTEEEMAELNALSSGKPTKQPEPPEPSEQKASSFDDGMFDDIGDEQMDLVAELGNDDDADNLPGPTDLEMDELAEDELAEMLATEEEKPVEPAPTDAEIVEAIMSETTEAEALIEEILEYETPARKSTVKSLLEERDVDSLKAILDNYKLNFGSPSCKLIYDEIEELITENNNSPATQKLIEGFEQKRAENIKLMQQAQAVFGSDIAFEKVLMPSYHEAAKSALKDLALFRSAIVTILNRAGLMDESPDVASSSRLMFGLRRAAAFLDVTNGQLRSADQSKRDLCERIARLDKELLDREVKMRTLAASVTKELAEIEKRVRFDLAKGYLISRSRDGRFLANSDYIARVAKAQKAGKAQPKQSQTKRLNAFLLVWTRDPKLAMRFASSSDARNMIETLAMKKNPGVVDPRKVMFAGTPLKEIMVAVDAFYSVAADEEGGVFTNAAG